VPPAPATEEAIVLRRFLRGWETEAARKERRQEKHA